MQIKKKKLFLFQLQICGSSSACRKKTRCRRMAPVPPFWDICQWKNFPGNLNTWPNTSSKRFFLLPFLQPKKKPPKIYAVTLVLPLKVISTMEHYIKLLTIFIYKFSIFWIWQRALWNLGQLAPASFFYLQQPHDHHVWDIYVVDWPKYSIKGHLSR